MASLGFLMDGMLSFLPLIHNHLSFDDVAACSTLDFALRVFSPRIDMNHWHLREVISHHAGHGRSYSESRLWDEQGSLVASMTQQAIIRVPVESAKI
jgi:acyl-CoA thioesterase